MNSYNKYLIKLVNYEREAEINSMIDEIKRLTPQKREKAGRAINNLKGKYIGKNLGYEIVQFGRKEKIETTINIGDVVLISKGNPLKSDLTGTVTEKGSRFIRIAFEHLPKWILKDRIRIDLYINDVSFKRMEDNLKDLNYYGLEALRFLKKDCDFRKIRKIENIEFIDEKLNESQKLAIKKAMGSDDFFLIHGPFGTGKTRTLIELINQELKRGNKVLATAESNCAVDNILERLVKTNPKLKCTRLGHPQRILKTNIEYSLAYKIENHPLNKEIKEIDRKIDNIIKKRDKHIKPTPRYRRGYSDLQILLNASKKSGGRGIHPKEMISMAGWIEENKKIEKIKEKKKDIEKKIVRSIIKKSDLILSTNSSAALDEIKMKEFDVAIIDEASQTTIPSVLIPIAKASKFILAGDHKQLPPTVLSKKASDLKNTLFEGLINKYPDKSQILDVQYRMNDKLMKFPNKEFYQNKLKSKNPTIGLSDIVKTNEKSILFDDNRPLLFFDTSKLEDNFERHLKDSNSIINLSESKKIITIVKYYIDNNINNEDIGIISPYLDQVRLIGNKTDIEVNTVDGFQGREKEIIIISTVRSNKKGNIGFLSDLRRLNVSLTRAKRKLIIVGNKDTLSSNDTYKKLLDYCEKNNSIIRRIDF